MISEHFNAIKARIELGTGLSGKVHDTVRLDANGAVVYDQYVILYRSAPDVIETGRLTAVATVTSELTFTVDVRAVGATATAAGLTMDRVLTQLVGHSLVVTGRACSPLRVESAGRVQPDTTLKPFLFYVDVGFEFTSRPA